MPFEAEIAFVRWGLVTAAQRLKSLAPLPSGLCNWLPALAILSIVAFAFLLRSLHLFTPGHHYIINVDSYYFHWLADRIMAGEGPPSPPGIADTYTLHSGLAYPLAYIAKAVGSVFSLSSAYALELTSKFLPPVLSIVTMVVIYVAATRLYNRQVGLFSAFAWAGMFYAVVQGGGAGYLDRDVLNILLFTIGAFLFHASKGWQFRARSRNLGWLAGGVGVLGIEGLLYLEWNFVGPALLLAVLITYSVARYLVEYVDLHKMVASTRQRLMASLGAINWRVLAFVIGVNILAAGALHSRAADALRIVRGTITSGGSSNIGELQGMGLIDIGFYQLFLIPMLIGLYLTFARREGGNGFVTSWFLCLLVLSLFAERILLLATPAACVLAGAGFASFWTRGGWTLYKPLLARYAVALFFLVLILISYSMARGIGDSPRTAVNSDWQDTLDHLRDNTPQDAVVMTWWDYGYWILDIAQRRPVVDNGYYGWDLKRMADIRKAYVTTEPSVAAQVMDKYGADYLVFSKLDENIAPSILWWPYAPRLENGEVPSFPEDSLVARSLAGDFPSEGGLALWYASPDHENPEVVILKRTRPQNP